MAINTGRRTSFVDRASVKDNIDDRLDFVDPTELPFLNYLGFMTEAGGALGGADSLSFPCTQTRHTWMNDELVPSVSSVQTVYTSGDATLVVASGHGARFDVDDLVMCNTTYWIVTAVSSDTLTVTDLESTDATCAAGSVIYLLGNARVEGTAASVITARSSDFGSTENYSQIFMAKVDMAGSEESTERHGVDDPYEYQVNKRLKELAIQLEKAAIYGIRNATYPSTNTTPRRMGGLAHFVRDASGAILNDADGEDFDEIRLGDVLEDVWTAGGEVDTLMVSARQKRVINSWIVPAVRMERTESTAGVIVGEYVSDFGKPLMVVVNRWMKPSDAILTTKEFIGIGPLAGNGRSRAFFREALPKDGDYERDQIIGEYTMEVRNALKAHAWIKNLSTE